MAVVLDNVLNGTLSADYLVEWILADTSNSFEHLRSHDKSDFVLFFLNYIKDSCNWLLSSSESENESVQNSLKGAINKQISAKDTAPLQSENRKVNNASSRNLQSPCITEHAENVNFLSSIKNSEFNSKCFVTTNSQTIVHKRNNFQRTGFNSNKNCQTFSDAPHSNRYSDGKPEHSVTIKTQKFAPDIGSFDMFPPIGGNNTSIKTSRRITPTPIQSSKNNSKQFSNSFFCVPEKKISNEVFESSPFQEKSNYDLKQEREMIKRTRDGLFDCPISQNALEQSRIQVLRNRTNDSVTIKPIVPDPTLILSSDKIQICVKIYNCFLNNGFVPNITSELYFVFRLLTSRINSQSSSDSIFQTVHNCVYFAVSVLNNQQYLLSLLDKSTLTTLVEIPYLEKFSPELVSFLKTCYSNDEEKKTKLSILNSVPYQVDDDNRNNFPDDISFQNFKKQRDIFYELLREWQQQHLIIDVNFQGKFICKVRHLISMGSNNVTNFYHLARLIQSQLIASCLCFEVDEVYDELLVDIQHNFPDKFNKLQERFLTPSNAGILSPPQSFFGIQLFFCELIETASSATLNQYLSNLLIDKILQLNDANICDELYSSSEIKERFTSNLHTLRLLAKFLGFVQFLPYKIYGQLPNKLLKDQVCIRENILPPFHIMDLFHKAISRKHLVLTVPWIIEYLSMMDEVSRNLKYNHEIFKLLAEIYRGKYASMLEKRSFLFLKFVIGWLFDIHNFPFKFDMLVQPLVFEKHSAIKVKCLDLIHVIDKQLIYSCCPYLIEFKILIDDFLNGIRSNNRETRKITPVSTTNKSLSSNNQQIELNLEENFYSLHPPSVKNTVEFVAQRIASKVIYKIRINITNMKLNVVENISSNDSFKCLPVQKLSMQQKFKKIVEIVDSNTPNLSQEIKNEAHCLARDVGLKDIENILPILLPEETKVQVLEACINICFRLSNEKINEWCETNLPIKAIKLDICNKLQYILKNEKSNGNNNTLECKNVTTETFNSLRQTIIKVHVKPDELSTTKLMQILEEMSFIVSEKCMMNSDHALILSLTVELCLSVLTCSPNVWSSELCVAFILIWQGFPEGFNFLKKLLCPKNIYLLQNSKFPNISLSLYAELLVCVVKENVCSVEMIKECLNCIKKTSPEWKSLPFLIINMEKKCYRDSLRNEFEALRNLISVVK